MSKVKLIIVTFISVVTIGFSQTEDLDIMSDLEFYADIMINASESKHRAKAASLFESKFLALLDSPNSYQLGLDSLKWISKLEATEQSFRIFSWLITDDQKVTTPYGYIQLADGEVIQLIDNAEVNQDSEFETADANSWLGALYYHMMPLKEGSSDYILFGYRQIDRFNKLKIAEVVSVTDGAVTFGKEVFVKEVADARDEVRTRIILDYSADANVTLNYNSSMEMIVYDNLITRMGRLKGQGPTQLPDGSFIGYEYDGNQWVYVDKLFDQVSETAPRPMPVLGDKQNDIFGKKKDNPKKKRRN